MVTIKIRGSQSAVVATPTAAQPASQQQPLNTTAEHRPAVRISIPTRNTTEGADASADAGATVQAGNNGPRLRIKTPGTSQKIKIRRRHEPGLGYDSEASDREENPKIEEQIILRMRPGPDCDYLREAIAKRQIGNGANVWLKFKDSRHAVVSVNDHMYAAKLVDLPCIIESQKSFDRKRMFKAADISQMLLVGDMVMSEDQVLALAPRDKDYAFPHGLTPPMQNVRTSRFRKRVSHRVIETVEAEVDRLLGLDAQAQSSTYELVDRAKLARESSVAASDVSDYDFRYGREDTEDTSNRDNPNDNLDLELDAVLGADDGEDESGTEDDEVEQPNKSARMAGTAPDDSMLAGQIEQSLLAFDREQTHDTTGNGGAHSGMDDNDDDDDDDDDDEDEEDDDDEVDDAVRESNQQHRLIRTRINELDSVITQKKRDAERATNPILRNRFLADIAKLSAERDMKQSQLLEDGRE